MESESEKLPELIHNYIPESEIEIFLKVVLGEDVFKNTEKREMGTIYFMAVKRMGFIPKDKEELAKFNLLVEKIKKTMTKHEVEKGLGKSTLKTYKIKGLKLAAVVSELNEIKEEENAKLIIQECDLDLEGEDPEWTSIFPNVLILSIIHCKITMENLKKLMRRFPNLQRFGMGAVDMGPRRTNLSFVKDISDDLHTLSIVNQRLKMNIKEDFLSKMIENLTFHYCHLSQFPEGLELLVKLTRLNVGHNEIYEIPHNLKTCHSLRIIDMGLQLRTLHPLLIKESEILHTDFIITPREFEKLNLSLPESGQVYVVRRIGEEPEIMGMVNMPSFLSEFYTKNKVHEKLPKLANLSALKLGHINHINQLSKIGKHSKDLKSAEFSMTVKNKTYSVKVTWDGLKTFIDFMDEKKTVKLVDKMRADSELGYIRVISL